MLVMQKLYGCGAGKSIGYNNFDIFDKSLYIQVF